jgi:Mg2+ and Co2+ transporter CorA
MSLASTIKRLNAEFSLSTACDSDLFLPQSLDCLLEESQLLQKRVEILRERVQDITTFAHEKLNHLNTRYMMQVAQSTKNDSAAMKYITIITVLFLPATFVAVRLHTPYQPTICSDFPLDLLLHATGECSQWQVSCL